MDYDADLFVNYYDIHKDVKNELIKETILVILFGFPICVMILGIITSFILNKDPTRYLFYGLFFFLLLRPHFHGLKSCLDTYDKIKRFKIYIEIVNEEDYILIKELSQEAGFEYNVVRNDIEDMIDKRWFLQGHLDTTGKVLILNDHYYYEYMRRIKELDREKSQQLKRMDERYANLSSEAREVMVLGESYLDKIRECNEKIDDPVMSDKISEIETIVDRIFTRVGTHNENVSDLRKMLKYYLPMTIKLLETYIDYDRSNGMGENITRSKKEIESTLDTLNRAFNHLLDDLMVDHVIKVSFKLDEIDKMINKEEGI